MGNRGNNAGYSRETMVKFIGNACKKLAYYKENVSAVKACISAGNKKIGRTMNVSLLPIVTCANCAECKRFCYDIKANIQYGNVLNARARNTALALYNRAEYFEQIKSALSRRRKNFFFRWHVAGDIIDMDYLENMIVIARAFPHFTFWTYTKNYTVVNNYVYNNGGNRKTAIPGNLSIMFSEWKGLTLKNPYNFPVFTCIFPGEKAPRGFVKCPGNCDACIAGKTGCPYGKSGYVDLH